MPLYVTLGTSSAKKGVGSSITLASFISRFCLDVDFWPPNKGAPAPCNSLLTRSSLRRVRISANQGDLSSRSPLEAAVMMRDNALLCGLTRKKRGPLEDLDLADEPHALHVLALRDPTLLQRHAPGRRDHWAEVRRSHDVCSFKGMAAVFSSEVCR